MKPIENIAIVGFGSLGAMYAGCFGAAMGPERVFVVADTARTERYRAEAATFNGEPIRVTYLTYDEAAERAAEDPFDVVLYAVKYGALPEAIEQSAPLVGPDTAIISVLNGVTSEEVLAERFGWDRVLLCVAQQMDSRKVGATMPRTRPSGRTSSASRNGSPPSTSPSSRRMTSGTSCGASSSATWG